MTDKEIIEIDGINVLECEHYQYKSLKDCEMRYPESGDCEIGLLNYLFDGNLDMEKSCKDNPNCYFKQLARKTQEFETICKAFDIEYGYDEETGAIIGRCNKLIEKEKVLEEYKQSLDEKNKFLQDLGISASGEFKRIKFYIEDLKNKYDEKVKELEEKLNAQFAEMKEKLTAEEMKNYELKKKLRDLELKNTILQNRYQQLDGSMTEFNHYHKALEEIEEYIYTDCEYNDGCDRNICIRCDYSNVHDKRILDIINEVKGEGNAI